MANNSERKDTLPSFKKMFSVSLEKLNRAVKKKKGIGRLGLNVLSRFLKQKINLNIRWWSEEHDIGGINHGGAP